MMEGFLIWSNPITWLFYICLWLSNSFFGIYKYASNVIYLLKYTKRLHQKTDNDILIAYANIQNLRSRKWYRRKFKLSIIKEYRKRTYKLIEG